jgi:succinoglycan biosynthesis protein ExoA
MAELWPLNGPFVSVLLPVRGESRELEESLASLAAQTYPHGQFELLIADASDTALDPRSIPDGLDARIVPNPERLMSRGLNLVARSARGSHLAIVSAHSAVPPDYLEVMVRTAHETGAANVGTRIKKVARSPWGWAIAAATTSPLGVGGSIQHHGRVAGPADSAFPGFIERTIFDALDGFNPALACNEDDEFNARVRAAGGLVWYEPAVEVTYHPRETLNGLVRQQFRYGRWKVAVARLGIPGYLRPRHLAPTLAVVGAIVLPVATLLWPPATVPLVIAAAAYTGIASLESRRMAHLFNADWWRVATVFPLIHAAYGIGFLRGLFDRGLPDEGQPSVPAPAPEQAS